VPTNPSDERWLDQEELAERYKVSIETIRDWRRKHYGPAGVKFGRGRGGSVRYRLSAVEQFERETEQAQAAP
jgi:hypothetical protein